MMDNNSNQHDLFSSRIDSEWQTVQSLSAEARFWNIEQAQSISGQSGRQWLLTFSAPFVSKVTTASQWSKAAQPENDAASSDSISASDVVELGDELIAVVSFPASYPSQPPTIQLKTPVFHPNIAADGIVNLADIGIVWNPEVSMDLVFERFWNVVRGSYMDTNNPVHIGAGNWFKRQTELTLPIDDRPLTEESAVNHNIVRYRRKGEIFRKRSTRSLAASESVGQRHVILDEDETHSSSNDAIHFID